MAKKENAGTEAYRPDPNRETILMADKAHLSPSFLLSYLILFPRFFSSYLLPLK